MNITKASVVLLLAFLTGSHSQCMENLSFENAIHRNLRWVDGVFKAHTNITSWLSCARFCLLRSLCKSFNYNEETLVCEINSEYGFFIHPLTLTPPWLYGDTRMLPKSLVDECAYHTCFDYQVCVPGEGGSNFCLDVEKCTVPPGWSFGNINYKKVNGTLELSCSDGLVGVGDSLALCLFQSGVFYWNVHYGCYDTSVCYVISGNTAVYTGTQAVTFDGEMCNSWSITGYSEVQLAELNASTSTNYCRDIQNNGNLYCAVVRPGPDGYQLRLCSVVPC